MKESNILLYSFSGVLGALVLVFFLVMFSENAACFVGELFGIKTDTESKKDTLQFLGWIISGFIGFFGLFALNRRAAAQDENNRLIEKGLSQERFKTAVDHLSNKESETARIASFYEFFYLARDIKDDYAQSSIDILCAHFRQITDYGDIPDLHAVQDHTKEVKTLASILFGQESGNVFDGLRFDLRRTNLTGIDFQGMLNPKEVDFSLAYLNKAVFDDVNLSDANFYGATLYESSFARTNLECADLRDTDFFCADLSGANFSHAKMENAILYGAQCVKSNFHKVNLFRADFCSADLFEAKNLETCLLGKAKYNDKTTFPEGFDPDKHGMIYCPPDDKK